MPELPEVEMFRRYVAKSAVDERIERVTVADAALLEGISPAALRRRLRGRRIAAARRHGKHLLIETDEGTVLGLHFGMSGYPWRYDEESESPDHRRLVLGLAGGSSLAFVCPRRLGRVRFAPDAASYVEARRLGPDALAVSPEELTERLSRRRCPIKAALLDQGLVAGIGNVYADEILFQAGVAPDRPASGLDDEQARRLHSVAGRVLSTSIRRRANWNDLPRRWLLCHRRRDGSCPRCREALLRTAIGGRTTYSCPYCQPPGRAVSRPATRRVRR